MPVGELLKAFFRFYATEFDWRREAVSVRAGRRTEPGARFPLHIVVSEDGKTSEVGPSVEDLFDGTNNLGVCMNVASLQHLQKEFRRAHELCVQGGSLTELLQPWAPAVQDQ
jgi:hypothetical protein